MDAVALRRQQIEREIADLQWQRMHVAPEAKATLLRRIADLRGELAALT